MEKPKCQRPWPDPDPPNTVDDWCMPAPDCGALCDPLPGKLVDECTGECESYVSEEFEQCKTTHGEKCKLLVNNDCLADCTNCLGWCGLNAVKGTVCDKGCGLILWPDSIENFNPKEECGKLSPGIPKPDCEDKLKKNDIDAFCNFDVSGKCDELKTIIKGIPGIGAIPGLIGIIDDTIDDLCGWFEDKQTGICDLVGTEKIDQICDCLA